MLRRYRKLTIGLSLMMLLAGTAIVIAALSGVGSEEKGRTIPGPVLRLPDLAPVTMTPLPPQPTSTPEPQPTPEPSRAGVQRLAIPGLAINASIVVLGVDKDGVMQDPKGPRDVAWYNFSALPGWGGNAVFAGHVDYAGYGPAIFWKLRELKHGDEIKVGLDDGTEYTYRVISAASYSAADAPVQEIVGPTAVESVTLITCGGSFNTRTREYDKRLIVRAERVFESASVVR